MTAEFVDCTPLETVHRLTALDTMDSVFCGWNNFLSSLFTQGSTPRSFAEYLKWNTGERG
jgi:hypothetical protein